MARFPAGGTPIGAAHRSSHMDDLAEMRVFAERTGAARLAVAVPSGLVVVSVADDRVGEFGMGHRCSPRDLAVGPEGDPRLVVATDEDVLLADGAAVDGLAPSGFGPAVVVTVDGGRRVAGSGAGRIGVHDPTGWGTVGELPSPPTALDGDLVGTAEGVFRLVDEGLSPAGLTAVADVAHAGGVPLAATADGLYELGNGWLDVLANPVRLVWGAADGRAHAATETTFYGRLEGTWQSVELPTESPVVAIAYGDRSYALDADGDLLIESPDGWRAHALGLEGATAMAVLDRGPG